MIAIFILLLFLASGIFIIRRVLPNLNILANTWIGVCLGMVLLMILPAGLAFIFNFTKLAHYIAIAIDALLVALVCKFTKKSKIVFSNADKYALKKAAIILIPFIILMSYLQITHNIMPKNGALYVGQSTYGDLSLHLSIITSTPGSKFPMDYSIFPGVRLGYPFLVDTLSSSLYMFGLSLQASIVVPGIIMSSFIFFAYYLLALEFSKDKRVAILAFLLLFLNGGLGFVYDFDMVNGKTYARLMEIFTGYYKTPTNRPDLHNLVWSNIIADMILPQRTFMAGLFLFLPCIYLIIIPYTKNKLLSKNELIVLILLSSSLPMTNTHAFLALGVFSIFQMIFQTLYGSKDVRKKIIKQFFIFGAFTIALTMPQLLTWTFGQSLENEGFIKWHFNWVNNNGQNLRDLYPIFYLKNMGIIVIPILMTLFTKNKKHRAIIFSSFAIFIMAELIQFQPNRYDNNKLIYLSFLITLLPCSVLIIDIYDRLHDIPARRLLALIFIIVSTLAGSLSIARECVSEYQAYNPDSVAIANFVKENTDKNDVFITADNHLNPVSSLAGRKIVCGPDLWLYYHGINTTERKKDISNFYENPNKYDTIIDKYNIKYILYGPYEETSYNVDEEKLNSNFNLIYSNSTYKIYSVN